MNLFEHSGPKTDEFIPTLGPKTDEFISKLGPTEHGNLKTESNRPMN